MLAASLFAAVALALGYLAVWRTALALKLVRHCDRPPLPALALLLALPMAGEAATVSLAWDAYVHGDTPAETIEVWRRDQAPGTTYTARLGRVPATATAYDDATAVPGKAYCYVITAKNATLDVESGHSNEVCKAVPVPPPLAPRNLRVVTP